MIDWELFRKPIEKSLAIQAKAPGGRPAFDKLMMFKILILQRYYNLSDEQTKIQIKDRLSFMDFLGIQLHDKVPDENTIWGFKEKFKECNLIQTLFDLFTHRLQLKGIVAKVLLYLMLRLLMYLDNVIVKMTMRQIIICLDMDGLLRLELS